VKIGKKQLSIPKIAGAYDDKKLLSELIAIKKEYPDKKDGVITVMEELTYDDLIHGMDMLLQSGFEDISVAAGGGAP